MNLNEWRILQVETQREKLKGILRDGGMFEKSLWEMFSAQDIDELHEEIEIESFEEAVEWDGEIELTEADEFAETPSEIFEFVADQSGEKMDVEVEIDTSMYDLTEEVLEAMKDLFFAEDYEVVLDEAAGKAGKAKVVFKRAAGKITKTKKCGKGMSLKGNRCIPQTGTKKAKNRIRGIKIKRAKKTMGGGKKKKAAIKAKITKRRVSGRARNYAGIK
jgi:hypothetical protein